MGNILHQLEREEDDANLAHLRSEVERLRLTDAEREAVECGIHAIGIAPRDDKTLAFADVLQRLLERTK